MTEDTTQPSVIRMRIALYILTLGLQSLNGILRLIWALRIINEDPDVEFYFFLSPRFFSVWTIIMHIINAALGLICFRKVSKYTKKEEKSIIYVRRYKKTFFCSIVWPSTWVCSTYFWFFYYYDKTLLKFNVLMKFGYPLNNHIEHTFILFASLCERMLQSGNEPKSHKRNILYLLSLVLTYVLVLCYSYITSGTWLYPFYDISYGTIYFPLMMSMSCVVAVTSYYAQWFIPRIKDYSLKKKTF